LCCFLDAVIYELESLVKSSKLEVLSVLTASLSDSPQMDLRYLKDPTNPTQRALLQYNVVVTKKYFGAPMYAGIIAVGIMLIFAYVGISCTLNQKLPGIFRREVKVKEETEKQHQ